jgi:hypothetical protein
VAKVDTPADPVKEVATANAVAAKAEREQKEEIRVRMTLEAKEVRALEVAHELHSATSTGRKVVKSVPWCFHFDAQILDSDYTTKAKQRFEELDTQEGLKRWITATRAPVAAVAATRAPAAVPAVAAAAVAAAETPAAVSIAAICVKVADTAVADVAKVATATVATAITTDTATAKTDVHPTPYTLYPKSEILYPKL